MSRIVGTIKAVGPKYIFAIEGYNEPESRHGCDDRNKCWVRPTRDHQARLFDVIKGDPATRHILVLSPSLKTQNLDFSPQMLGNTDSMMNGHNMHRYVGANAHPEQAKYLGKLDNVHRYVGSAAKPSFLTETGYSTHASGTTEAAQAVYMPRNHLYNFNFGLALTAKYELIDQATHSGNGDFEGNFGYIRTNNTPKPAFTAVKNLLALLSDRGPRFAPRSLNYALSGNTANIYKVLMQKRDGTFYLAMWVAQPMQSVAPHAVTLTVPSSIKSAAQARPNDGTGWRGLALSGGRAHVIVDEKVTIFRLAGGEKPPRC